MNVTFLGEPELEFGAGRHLDIRFGIMSYGPLDFALPVAPAQINVGIVGNQDSVEGVRRWFDRCRNEIAAKPSKQPNLFPRFPGFGKDVGFRSTLILDDSLCRDIPAEHIALVAKLSDRNERISRSVDLFMEEIQYLAQNRDAKVVVCAVPSALLDAMASSEEIEGNDSESLVSDIDATRLDFHDMLKARAMQQYRKPIQIVLPSTYDDTKNRRRSRAGRRLELQDEATRAWNIHTALYYKADGVPWRLPRDSSDLTTCFVGVSFYKSLDRRALLTSVAQVFNERGEGVVVRGRAANISKADLQPHLPSEHAYELLKDALGRYWDVHRTFPARVVIHKSSRFDGGEQEGFASALTEKGISTHDFLWISPSSTKLYRAGKYPPLRGTLLTLDEREMILYTRGSVDFFETYPGKYIPIPMRIRSEHTEQTQRFLAREVLSLSKMNWNNTQFDGAEPVTLQASRKCSNVLRYCSEGRQIEPRYSFYM